MNNLIKINGEDYVLIRTLKVGMGKTIPTEYVDEVMAAWRADKVFRQENVYYFLNTIQDVEPMFETGLERVSQEENNNIDNDNTTRETIGGSIDTNNEEDSTR